MLRILTWNVCCLPRRINLYHNPKNVIHNIIDQILDTKSDIIKLQEVFDFNIQKKIIKALLRNNYKIQIVNKSTSPHNNMISPNGLLTAVKKKYPITYQSHHEFQNYTSVEYFINKGIITSQIQHPELGIITLHNTHIQSDSMIGFENRCKMIRNKQFDEVVEYINSFSAHNFSIFSGDLNDDFTDSNLISMIDNINMKGNHEKIITFPSDESQLDYILINTPHTISYKTILSNLSDHYPLIADIKL